MTEAAGCGGKKSDWLDVGFDAGGSLIQHGRGGAGQLRVGAMVGGVQPELKQAGGEMVEKFFQWLCRDFFCRGVEDEQGRASRVLRIRPRVLRRHVDLEREVRQSKR